MKSHHLTTYVLLTFELLKAIKNTKHKKNEKDKQPN